jgi:hypothetical protein
MLGVASCSRHSPLSHLLISGRRNHPATWWKSAGLNGSIVVICRVTGETST